MDSSDDDLELIFLNIMALCVKRRKLQRQIRRWRYNPINNDWATEGYFVKTFKQIKEMNADEFFDHTRMSRQLYDQLLILMAPSLTKYKEGIQAEERLSLTLLFLAHGTTFQNLASSYKLGKTTVRNIVLGTCEAIWKQLSPIYLSEPTQEQYNNISNDFENLWNMPNCVGAIDGKHIPIKCPPNSGSMFLNNEKITSIVLLAACNAKYCFTAVGVEANSSQSDGGIFRATQFAQDLVQNRLPLPPETTLPSTEQLFPYYFVGDCAFPLKHNLMKPYPKQEATSNRMHRIFNYRLSRTRRVIENAFGIMTSRWRVLRKILNLNPDNSEKIILACVVLHNFCMLHDTERQYCPDNYADAEDDTGQWRNELKETGGPLRSIQTVMCKSQDIAYEYRNILTNYFTNQGAVDFQNSIV